MTHTEKLLQYLLTGQRICDHNGYAKIGVPNIRSRICNIEKKYQVRVDRERVKNKNYNEYFFRQIPIIQP